jgi:thiol-disulfide isomerase/thioredoxin
MKKIITAVVFITAFFITAAAQAKLNISFTDDNIAERHFLKCFYISGGKQVLCDSALLYDAYKTNLQLRLPAGYSGACVLSLDNPSPADPMLLVTPSETLISIRTSTKEFKDGIIYVDNSNENKVYSMVMELKKDFDDRSRALQKVRTNMAKYDSTLYAKVVSYENEFETIRKDFNVQLDVIAQLYPGTYTAGHIIQCLKQPARSDKPEYLVNYDNIESFMHYHYFDKINFNDTLLLNHIAFASTIAYYLANYTDGSERNLNNSIEILMNKASVNSAVKDFVFNLLLDYFLKRNYDYAVTHLNDKYADGCSVGVSPDKQKFVEALKNTQVGAKIPDLVLYDNNGQIKSLYNSFTQSKYTIFYVWTSWCHSCQSKTLVLMDILKKYKKTDVNLFAISLDEKKEDWTAGIAKYKLADYTNVAELVPMAKSTVLPSYAIRTTPKLYVLDNAGKIIAKDVYGDDLKKLLESLAK